MTPKAKFLLLSYGGLFLASAIICSAASLPNDPKLGIANGIFMTCLWAIPFGLYVLPTFIAALRDAPNFVMIAAVNIVVGWTGFAWLGCLIWALLDSKPKDPVIVQQVIYQNGPAGPPPLPGSQTVPEIRQAKTDQPN